MKGKKYNRLINEKSPYLRHHAHNPVDWYPWCEEAFNRAKEEDKPVLLSIGYSACHWCHVMERESFENEEIAEIMNKYFINIKVDREERPHIDELYQYALQLFGKRGGWPLTIFLTPEGKPFFGGTYFPPYGWGGQPGFKDVLIAVANAYKERKKEIEITTLSVERAFKELNKLEEKSQEINLERIDRAAASILRLYDTLYGGFGEAPKFPSVPQLYLLLQYYYRTKDNEALEAVENTLDHIGNGGIRDHIGGGFHRYSVDERWIIPHFEKMLYDNALLSSIYMDMYRIKGKSLYKDIAEETIEYMLREMFNPEGGFFSSQDADSEGEEGKYYLWDKKEIKEILGDEAEILCRYYGIEEEGNFEGRNIIYIDRGIRAIAKEFDLSEERVNEIIQQGRQRLFEYRQGRVPPFKDKKIICSWNGLAISSLVNAYKLTRKDVYLEKAKLSVDFIKTNLFHNATLYHAWIDGERLNKGVLEDYALIIQSLIELFEATNHMPYLHMADELTQVMVREMWDGEDTVFYNAPHDDRIFHRLKTGLDQFIPSGNGVAALDLIKLSLYCNNSGYGDMAYDIIKYFYNNMLKEPFHYASLMTALYGREEMKEITIVDGPPEEMDVMERFIDSIFIPFKVIYVLGKGTDSHYIPEFAMYKEGKGNRTTVYICHHHTCSEPLVDRNEVESYLSNL